jgi:phospholipase/carboxylesterase
MSAVPQDLGFKHIFHAAYGADDISNRTTLVLLHGTGGNEHDLLDLGRAIDPTANLLGVRGRSREEGQNRFFRRYAEGVFDEHDVMLQADGLREFLERSRASLGLGGPMVALGYSNGANMAAATLLLNPEVFQGAILLRAMNPLNPPELPNLDGVRVLMLSGEDDQFAPLVSSRGLAGTLREAGAAVTHRMMPTGHALSRADVQISLAWMAENFPTAA